MKKLFYLAIVLCAIACTNKKSSVNYAKFEPEDGKCLVFIGQDMEAIGGIEGKEGYVNFFGTPAGITIYTNIRPGDVSYGYTYQGLDGLTSNANWGAGNCFADAQLASPLLKGCDVAIGLELVNHEEKVASGEHDSYIIRLGEWIQNIAPRRVFLRIGYEFDGTDWNHYVPETYIPAYKHIKDHFDAAGIRNVAYVWQSKGDGTPLSDMQKWYPGDEYVDWCAYSYFGQPDQVMIEFARMKGKPVFIAESTPVFQKGQTYFDADIKKPEIARKIWDEWFTKFFSVIEENSDVVKAFSYINVVMALSTDVDSKCNLPAMRLTYSAK